MFASPRGRFARRSGYGRWVFSPAAAAAGWPRDPDGDLYERFYRATE